MFNYFNEITANDRLILDIFRAYEFDITTEDYFYHELVEGDNLMSISHKHYDTIDDWWCIYIFNDMFDFNFDIVNSSTIETSVTFHMNQLESYDSLLDINQKKVSSKLRTFYMSKGNDIKGAIILANELISNVSTNLTLELRDEIKNYIFEELINSSNFVSKIKIPSSNVVYKMKTKLEELRVLSNN